MKILSAEETHRADEYTIRHEPIDSIDLMERAATAFVSVFSIHYPKERSVKIFCGTGNNGGDGLAVARMLLEKDYTVEIYIVNYKGKGSDDFLANYERLKKIRPHIQLPVALNAEKDLPVLNPEEVLIDAVFGSGLSRPVEGFYARVIESMNNSGCSIVSIDIASGLFADKPVDNGNIVKPELTISFQIPKMAFFVPENDPYVGQFEVADIGLDKNFIESCRSTNHFIENRVLKNKFKKRRIFAHKGNFGKAMIISGGFGKMGAAVLSASACLHSGVGLLTMHVPACGYNIIQTAVPEAMTSVDIHEQYFTSPPDIKAYDVIGAGPGLGMEDKTVAALSKIIESASSPLVLDADAINILGKYKDMIGKLPSDSILTPHLIEFERIAGKCADHFERLQRQKEFAREYHVIVILKGAYTAIALPDGSTWFNSTGNPGMATGGSGDVLTGMVTGILAQGYEPADAAVIAVYLHGMAGDLAREALGEEGMTARDIIHFIPGAFRKSRS